MKSCCVVGCNGPATPNPILFEFPSSRLLRKRWLDAVKLPSAQDPGSVCIRHFTPADYTLEGGETRLRGRSVPSRRLGESDDEDSNSGSEESDSTESTASDTKKRKSGKNTSKFKDNEKTSKSNGDNRDIIEDNREIIKDNRKIIDNNENAAHKDNADNEKENNDIDIEKKDGENSKIDIEIQNTKSDNSYPDKNNTENCDNRLNNEKIIDDNEKINNDNEDVNNDNGKINNDNGNKKGKKTRCKITALRAINGRRKFSFSSDSSNSDSMSSSPNPSELEGHKEDIEEALQYYYIENKKTERQVAAMSDVINEDQEKLAEGSEKEEISPKQSEPVFIELSVGQGSNIEGQDQTEADCLMVLENVQCDVDPSLILAAREEDEENMEQVDLDDDDDDEPEAIDIKSADPISLLTSSDEDDVIIQEPKYDLVEVSSADTSEDDMPLVKLVKTSRKTSNDNVTKTLEYTRKYAKNLISKLIWGRNGFFCKQCGYTTINGPEFNTHMATHEPQLPSQKIIQYCQDCGFTTSSKYQMQRHRMKHKNEKRFKCPKCNYSAKHSMSLVYHMRTHKNEVELAICGTFEPEKIKKKNKGHKKSDDKKFKCSTCGYKTNRRSDMKRHRRRVHCDEDDDDDDEYRP